MSDLREELETMKKEMFEICSGEARALGLATVAFADPSEDEAESEEIRDSPTGDQRLLATAGKAALQDDGRRVFRDARGRLWELVPRSEPPRREYLTKNTESDYNLPSCERDEAEEGAEEGEWTSGARRREPA